MKDTDYKGLLEFVYMGGGFKPENEPAIEFSERCARGEVVALKEITSRDVSFHRAYFSLISYIYDYLPENFRKEIPKDVFYKWLKHLKKQYSVVYAFKDKEKMREIAKFCIHNGIDKDIAVKIALKFGRTEMVEYESISFGRMSESKFQEYVSESLPWIYENVIHALFDEETAKNIIETIEQDYLTFLGKLPS